METVDGLKVRVNGKKLSELIDRKIERFEELRKRYRTDSVLERFDSELSGMRLFQELIIATDDYQLNRDDIGELLEDPFWVRMRRRRKRRAASKKRSGSATRKANAAKAKKVAKP